MEKLRKKTSDAALEKLIVAAAKKGIETSWDRYEGITPLCGFGRLSMCCTLCSQGPCRINPFEAEDKATVCGRTRASVVAANFLRLVTDGVASIINYAGNNSEIPAIVRERIVDNDLLPGSTVKEMLNANNLFIEGIGNAEDYFRAAARVALAGYSALASIKAKSALNEVAAGVGALKADEANLLIIGAMAPEKVAEIKAAATGINVVGMCGAEHGVAIVGNYASEEALLLSGLIDAVVVGSACVTPGFLNNANKLEVPVFCAEDDDMAEAIEAARQHFEARQDLPVAVEATPNQAATGYTPDSFKLVKAAKLETLINKYPVKGVVIMGGCNNVKATQDQNIVEQAKALVANDVLVIATGCAAAALAKAGLMDADKANHFAGSSLVAFLGALAAAAGTGRLPAVLHCGTCWQLPAAVELASTLGLPISASFPEVSLPAAWSNAVALAALGIPTYVGPVLPVEGTPEAMEALVTVFNNNLLSPIEALTPTITAQQVAATLIGKE